MRYGPYIIVFAVALVATYAAGIGFGSMSFKDDLAERVVTHLLALVFFALLIERAVEVIVNNKFLDRELKANETVKQLQRKGKILQAALETELQQPVPAMADTAALAAASAAKNATIEDLRSQISQTKKEKITADSDAAPLREAISIEKAAFSASTATVLGGLVALTGTTVLSEFVVLPETATGGEFLGFFDQLEVFVAVDILFTALILAGGSDGIHQLVKDFLSKKDDLGMA